MCVRVCVCVWSAEVESMIHILIKACNLHIFLRCRHMYVSTTICTYVFFAILVLLFSLFTISDRK